MSEPATAAAETRDPATPVLQVKGLVKQFPGARALDGVDFDVRAGEVHCLLGPNGAGKSTLIKCVSGAVEPTEGEILLGGQPLPHGDPAASLDRGVATIYQELDWSTTSPSPRASSWATSPSAARSSTSTR
jgi:ribose transport system ATP-binding protein